jgi:hypothetical protein
MEVVGKGSSGQQTIAGLCRSVVDAPNQTSLLGIVVSPSRTSFDTPCRENIHLF